MKNHIETIRHDELTEEMAGKIKSCAGQCFLSDREEHPWIDFEFEWATPDWHLCVMIGEEMASHLAITETPCDIAGHEVSTAGIGAVTTPSAWRRRGLAGKLTTEAERVMRERIRPQPDFGLLFCKPELVPYYAKFGWREIKDEVRIPHSTGAKLWRESAMWLPCVKDAWPNGAVLLKGNVF